MKACFFDLDGTLIDSIELIVRCFQHTVKTHLGISITRETVLSKIGMPLRPLLEAMSPGKGSLLTETYREMQYKLHDELVRPCAGIPELLAVLSKQDLHIGIVTSKARGGTKKALDLFGDLSSIFKTIITVDDCEKHKPEPDPLLKAAKIAGCLPKEAYYIGDTHFDMQAALAASMTPIGVTWGVADSPTLQRYTSLIFDEASKLSLFLCK